MKFKKNVFFIILLTLLKNIILHIYNIIWEERTNKKKLLLKQVK